MDSLHIFILAALQGLTEFLPISSSAHLVLLPQIMDWRDQGLVFDVAVHFGSLIAVVFYFRDEVRRMLRSWLRSVAGGEGDRDSLLAWWVIVGTLPVVRENFSLVVLAIIIVSVIPLAVEAIRAARTPRPRTG